MPQCPRVPPATAGLLPRLRAERGTALVEFAIVAPVLVLIILGILYFGRYEDYTNQETQLAEQGARWAAVNSNPGTGGQSLQAYIQSQAQPELQAGSSDVTPATVYAYYPGSGNTGAVGSPVRVCVVTTVKYPVFGLVNTTETVAQAATMRIEVAASNWTPDAVATVPSACPTS